MARPTIFALILLVAASAALANPIITLEDPLHPGSGTYNLLENTPNQHLLVYVSGGDAVSGVDFNMELGLGGPELGAPPAPNLTGLDLVTGTIFQNNYLPPTDTGSLPHLLTWWLATSNGHLPANGLLATVTVDTTGFFASDPVHSWPLAMGDTHNGPTDFLDGPSISATITDGRINLVSVPEPSTLALILALATPALAYGLRRARRATLPG